MPAYQKSVSRCRAETSGCSDYTPWDMAHSAPADRSTASGCAARKRPALAIVSAGALSALRHQRLGKSPFAVAQIKSHDPPPRTVNHVRPVYSIRYLGTDPSLRSSPNRICFRILHFTDPACQKQRGAANATPLAPILLALFDLFGSRERFQVL
jgi:hypothetical protein